MGQPPRRTEHMSLASSEDFHDIQVSDYNQQLQQGRVARQGLEAFKPLGWKGGGLGVEGVSDWPVQSEPFLGSVLTMPLPSNPTSSILPSNPCRTFLPPAAAGAVRRRAHGGRDL